MLTFRDMTLDDRDTVLPMVDAFYRSNAVDHPVPREIVERSFLAAAGNEPLLRRFRLEVTQMNQGAAHLYEKCGFQYLRYDQMVLDR